MANYKEDFRKITTQKTTQSKQHSNNHQTKTQPTKYLEAQNPNPYL